LSVDSDLKIRDCIVRLLARREHAVAEVCQKLAQRGFDAERTKHYVALFQQEGLLSDARYAEAYARSRVARGYGPLYIKHALSAKEVAVEDATAALQSFDDWAGLALQVRARRFGNELPEDFKSRAKQMRFLQQRGFSHDHIRHAMAEDD